MESTRDTAERVVKRLLGETTEPSPEPRPGEGSPDARPQPRPATSTVMREASASSTSVGKAWKKGKKTAGSGHAVAGKPGKVSYRESLLRHVNERLQQKRALAEGQIQEKMGSGSGMKGGSGKAKKALNTVAKKPGAVSYGKR